MSDSQRVDFLLNVGVGILLNMVYDAFFQKANSKGKIMSKLVELDPAVFIRKSDKAKLFRFGDSIDAWIPDSQVDDCDITIDGAGNELWQLILPEWLVVEKGLDQYITDTIVHGG